jgi:2-haloacid dehalogenase
MESDLSSVTTLVFDVMGTVVDMDGSVTAHTAATLTRYGLDPEAATALAQDTERHLGELMDDVRAGRSPWQSHRRLREAALRTALPAAGVAAPPADLVTALASVAGRLEPWPDSPAALADLRERFTVVALTNADLAEIAAFSRAAKLAWHLALSGELVRSFKPDPAVYALTTTTLELPPSQLLMVAAHPWDLRAAAEQGLRTAYVARPGAETPQPEDDFDLTVTDLTDLANQTAVIMHLGGGPSGLTESPAPAHPRGRPDPSAVVPGKPQPGSGSGR